MLFNCFKFKNVCFKVFFNKIVKFILANFWIWHQCSLKAGEYTRVCFSKRWRHVNVLAFERYGFKRQRRASPELPDPVGLPYLPFLPAGEEASPSCLTLLVCLTFHFCLRVRKRARAAWPCRSALPSISACGWGSEPWAAWPCRSASSASPHPTSPPGLHPQGRGTIAESDLFKLSFFMHFLHNQILFSVKE